MPGKPSILILAILLLVAIPGSSASGAAANASEIYIDAGHPDTISIVASNYQEKVVSEDDLMSCIGTIEKRPDNGMIFLSADTAVYFGLPAPETHNRAITLAKSKEYVLVLRNLTEGFNASRMFDLSKFDVIILTAPEVGDSVGPAELRAELGDKVHDFSSDNGPVPNKVILLKAPGTDAEVVPVDTGEGLFKTLVKFPSASLVLALYWLEDATLSMKVYNPKTNGKILTLNDDDDWGVMMSNESYASDINADKISAIVMPAQAPARMVKSAAAAGVQRVVLYAYSEEEIENSSVGDPVSLLRMIDSVGVFDCLHQGIELFWYRT